MSSESKKDETNNQPKLVFPSSLPADWLSRTKAVIKKRAKYDEDGKIIWGDPVKFKKYQEFMAEKNKEYKFSPPRQMINLSTDLIHKSKKSSMKHFNFSAKSARKSRKSRKSVRKSRKSRKSVRKSRKSRKSVRKSRKSRKSVKSRKSSRKSVRKSRKSRKSVRKSRKSRKSVRKSRKSRKSVRKSRKSARKSRKSVRKSRKTARKSKKGFFESLFDFGSRKSARKSRKSTKKLPKLSKDTIKAIKMKLNNSPKVADSFTIIEGRYKPTTFLKFSKKNKELYVSIYKKQAIYDNQTKKHKHKSKYVGKFKAAELI